VTRTLPTPDGPVAVLDAGDGPAVLFVPGYTGTKEDFGPLLPLLADAGLRAVAMDLPGQYQTPGPDHLAAYTPDALSRSVLAVAARLDRPHLVGHSFGGLVSRAAVIADPGAVRSLVLMGSGPAAIGGDRRERMAALEPVLRAGGMPAVYEALETIAAADPEWASMSADQRAFLRTRFLAGSPAGLQGMGDALRAEPDRTAELAATGLPLLALRRARRRLVARGAGGDGGSARRSHHGDRRRDPLPRRPATRRDRPCAPRVLGDGAVLTRGAAAGPDVRRCRGGRTLGGRWTTTATSVRRA